MKTRKTLRGGFYINYTFGSSNTLKNTYALYITIYLYNAKIFEKTYTRENIKDDLKLDIERDITSRLNIPIGSLSESGLNDKIAELVFLYDNYTNKVTVIDEELGIAIDVVVTEIEINVDKTGHTYTPTFGNSIPTMLDKLERK